MELTLTPRLQAIADQVPVGCRFADIGTDHAYLPVWLLLQGKIEYAVAADLREGPLSRARETAERFGVADRISCRLCDGLFAIRAEEVDAIAIAGMGGETIAMILEAAPWTKLGTKLFLQPMTSFQDLRVWLQNNGYAIEHESIVREGKRLYTVLSVVGGKMDELSPAELWVGRQSDDPLRREYLEFMAGKVSKALAGQSESKKQDKALMAELSAVLRGIEEMIEEL